MSLNRREEGLVLFNSRGGAYQPGRAFSMIRRQQIGQAFTDLAELYHPRRPTVMEVANAAQVSWDSAKKVMGEIMAYGHVLDHEFICAEAIRSRQYTSRILSPEEEIFILSLRALKPTMTNMEYVEHLRDHYGVVVSSQFISHWFKHRWEFKGTFKTASFTPLDKFLPSNWLRWSSFALVVNAIEDHRRLAWLDEKHFVNAETYNCRARSCPLTGRVETICVDGNFCDTFNCFAVVSAHPEKEQAMVYSVGRENGNSRAFLGFIKYLILSS